MRHVIKNPESSPTLRPRDRLRDSANAVTTEPTDPGAATKSLLSIADVVAFRCRRGYPQRPVAWRWRRAHYLVATGGPINPRSDDPEVERIHRYLTLARDDQQAATEADPPFARAEEIYRGGGEEEALLRAYLVTELSLPEVAERTGLDCDVVEAYHTMYFDVLNRRMHKHWMIMHAIGLHGRTFGNFEQREYVTWQFEALDGSRALEELLALANPIPNREDHPTRRIDRDIARNWRYQLYVLLVTTPWSEGNPQAWQRLYYELRRRELRQRQQQLMSEPWWENLPSLEKCSTSNA